MCVCFFFGMFAWTFTAEPDASVEKDLASTFSSSDHSSVYKCGQTDELSVQTNYSK